MARGSSAAVVMILGAIILIAGLLAAPGVGIYKLPLATVGPTGTYFDHTVIIVLENEGMQDICLGNPPPCSITGPAPFMAGLANNFSIAQRYTSVYLPLSSAPNYIGLLAGSTFNCNGGGCGGAGGTLNQPNLVDRLETAGLSWKAYFENYPLSTGCIGFVSSGSTVYNWLHNPFIQFSDIYSNTARCSHLSTANPASCGIDQATTYASDCNLINDLNSANAPSFAWLTPNECDNMHGHSLCSNACTTGGSTACINIGNAYLSHLVPQILSSAAFTTGRGALFITFDEGNGYCPFTSTSLDCIYAVWSGPEAATKKASGTAYNHYSWLKTVETNWGLASLQAGDTSAQPMTEYLVTGPPPPPPLTAAFSYSPIQPTTGTPVTFSAFASGGLSPYFYTWSFGDGASASSLTSSTTSHTYTAAGTFNVQLFVTDSKPGDSYTTSSPLVVTVPVSQLVTDFTFAPVSPAIGQSVTFSSTISGGVTPYSPTWNFGDGSTGTGSTVIHSFASSGSFTVALSVTDSASPPNSDTATHSLVVTGSPPQQLSASFTWSPGVPVTNNVVTFSAAATGGSQPYGYGWSFGDGLTGTGQLVTHTYGTAGTYTVTLTVTDNNNAQTTSTNQVTIQQQTTTGGGGGVGVPLWGILTVTGLSMILVPALVFRRR